MDEIAAEFANFLEDDSPTGNTVDDRDVSLFCISILSLSFMMQA